MQQMRSGRRSDLGMTDLAEEAAWLRKWGETRSHLSKHSSTATLRSFSDLSTKARSQLLDSSLHQEQGASLLSSRSMGATPDDGLEHPHHEGYNGHGDAFQTNPKQHSFPLSPSAAGQATWKHASQGSPVGMEPKDAATELFQKSASATPSRSEAEIINFMQMQMLAFIVVFAASGLVPMEEILFVLFSSTYSLFLSMFAFPAVEGGENKSLFGDSPTSWMVQRVGSVIGLFLPLVYTLGGFARGNPNLAHAATPHLFLLSCQILSENLIEGWPSVSLPVRVLLPITYNTRRLFTLRTWLMATRVREVVDSVNQAAVAAHGLLQWNAFGRLLALVNLTFWSINLFCVLVPFSLYQAFRHYVEQELASEQKGGRGPTPFQALKEQLVPEVGVSDQKDL